VQDDNASRRHSDRISETRYNLLHSGAASCVKLASLSPGANPAHAIDFRSVYATALERWWEIGSRVLGGRFDTLPILRA
jgi:hypothetical protein